MYTFHINLNTLFIANYVNLGNILLLAMCPYVSFLLICKGRNVAHRFVEV